MVTKFIMLFRTGTGFWLGRVRSGEVRQDSFSNVRLCKVTLGKLV